MTPAEAARPALRLVGDGGQGEAGGAVFNLYAVTASDAVAAIAGACAEWDVRPVTHGDLAAIIAPAGTSFDHLGVRGSDPSSDGELDLDALGEVARRHEAVMGKLLSVTSVVPFRIGMAVRSERDAARLLRRHAGTLREALGWVTGRAEWSVRVWSVTEPPEPAAEEPEVVAEGPGSPSVRRADLAEAASPGRAYLLERRSARERAAQILRWREKLASAILSDLEPVVAGISFRPAGAGRTRANGGHPSSIGSEATGLLDVVVLADRAADEAIFETVRSSIGRLGGGLRARLTGPWPPYHFVGDLGSRAEDGADDWSVR